MGVSASDLVVVARYEMKLALGRSQTLRDRGDRLDVLTP